MNANADALSCNPVVTETEKENKTDNEDSEISNEDAMKNHGYGGCFVGSKVLYHEYPIERVFVNTCEMDCDELDITGLISHIYRETRDEDDTDFEVVDEMIGHSRVVSSLPKPKPVRWGSVER